MPLPLPPVWDPARAKDKLPQPFRLIDKIIAEIIEQALAACAKKEELKKLARATNIGMRFPPHALLIADGSTTCFTTPGIAGLVILGTITGEVHALTARDSTAVGKDRPHVSQITAMDAGHIPATGSKVVASASRGHLVVHEVIVKTAELTLLAKTDLLSDPDNLDKAPKSVVFSSNAGHIAVCYDSGDLAVYELELPPSYYKNSIGANSSSPDVTAPGPDGHLSRSDPKGLNLVLHMSVASVTGLLVGSSTIGTCNIEWQLRQRPDKSGKSDRNHKPASGVYMWWKGCNRLAFSYLEDHSAPSIQTSFPSTVQPSSTAPPSSQPPKTPPPKGAKGGQGAVPEPAVAPDLSMGNVLKNPHKTWILPHKIMCSCCTEDGTMLAFGMSDGTVIVWDDHVGAHIRILPRMPSAVSAMSYVNGISSRLFCTSEDGSIYIADFARPEDSYTAKMKLPVTCTKAVFIPGDPFAICMCPGTTGASGVTGPRLMWYDMTEQKLVAECVGKNQELNFGTSCMIQQPVSTTLAPPDTAAAAPTQGEVATSAVSDPSLSSLPLSYPRWTLKESYLVAGGPLRRSTSFRPPQGVLPEEVPDSEWPQEAVLLLFKVDALARYLMPEENQSKASKSLLERMLAELDPPKRSKGKHVKYDQPDPDAPRPPPSALRRHSGSEPSEDDDDVKSIGGTRRHIAFDGDDLFDDESPSRLDKKHFKKETVKGGYSEGSKKPGMDITKGGAVDLAALMAQQVQLQGPSVPSFAVERPASPPWHHTNPLARIHPDWEEAPTLARIMDRIGTKGGGRKKRERRLGQVATEMSTKLAKEAGPKPVLLTKDK